MPNDYFNFNSPISRHSGASSDVLNNIFRAIKFGFDKLPSPQEVREGRMAYVVATNAGNNYAVTVPFTLTQLSNGLTVTFRVAQANIGPSTLNVNESGPLEIRRYNNAQLLAGDMPLDSINVCVYDGTSYRLISPHGASELIATTAATNASSYASTAVEARDSALAAANSSQTSANSAISVLNTARFGLKNLLVNTTFWVNQRIPTNFFGTYPAFTYVRDRWKAGSTGVLYSVADATMAIASGSVMQIVQGRNIVATGQYTLSWDGTATATVNSIPVANGGQVTLTAFQNATVEFRNGNFRWPQLEYGSIKTNFEFRPNDFEREICYQYYQKSYDDAVTPGSAILIPGVTGLNTGSNSNSVVCVALNTVVLTETFFRFVTRMRTSPTIVVYDLKGNTTKVTDVTKTIAQSVHVNVTPQIGPSSELGFGIWSNNLFVAGNDVRLHWVADAEL